MIFLLCIPASYVAFFIFYFLKFIFFDRKYWIEEQIENKTSPYYRELAYRGKIIYDKTDVPIRPTIKDMWEYEVMDVFGYFWTIPFINLVLILYSIIELIFRFVSYIFNIISKIKI